MQNASDKVHLTLFPQEEDIYQDEVADGIANCADEQAQVWAQAANEEENSDSKQFVQELLQMTKKFKEEKAGAARAGAMGCKTRVQPRYQKGKQHVFDQLVQQRIESDRRAASMTDAELTERRAIYQTMCAASVKEYVADARGILVPENSPPDDIPPVVLSLDWPAQVGFGGDDAPRGVFPPIVGRPRHCGVMVGMGQKDSYVGDEAQSKRGILTMKMPIERGVIVNFDDYEKLLHHSFYNELRVAPEEHVVVLLEAPGTSTAERHKICQIMFETFSVPALSFLSRPVAAVCASGRAVGINVELGRNCCWVVPVVDGYALAYASKKLNYGMANLTDYLMKIMTERGYSFTTTAERDIVEDMRAKCCYVADNFDQELGRAAQSSSLEKSYELPDGQVITIGNERFRTLECLFQPSYLGLEDLGLADSVCECILALDPSLRTLMLKNITISGQKVEGLSTRLQNEVASRVGSHVEISVYQDPSPQYQAWVGGSILSSLGLPLVSKEDYDEKGPSAVDYPFPYNGFWSDPRYEPVIPAQPPSSSAASVRAPPPVSTPQSIPTPSGDTTKQPEVEKETKDNTVIRTQEEANGNCLLVHVGKACEEASEVFDTRMHRGFPSTCFQCAAVFNSYSTTTRDAEGNPIWMCEFCGTDSVFYREPVASSHYLLEECSIPGEGKDTKENAVPASTVIFCIDTSGSMGSYDGGAGKTRLQLIQEAVRVQLDYLRDNRPDTKVILLGFGSDVHVYYPIQQVYQRLKTINQKRATIQTGKELAPSFTQSISEVFSVLQDINRQLTPGGCTALGPCLSVAVGIAAECSQASIILFTDGEANVGEGTLDSPSGLRFYPEIAAKAAKNGTRIDVVTMEGEESGMAHLGQLADGTSGTVDVVDLKNIEASLKACVASQSIAKEIECLTVLPKHLQFRSPYENSHTQTRYFGSIHAHSLMSWAYEWTAEGIKAYQKESVVDMNNLEIIDPTLKTLLIQNQITYTDKYGNRKCFVETVPFEVVARKDCLENQLDSSVIAIEAIHRAATLAQESKFDEARILLVSVQRLLQRNIRAPGAQKVYLAFIVQAENLDGFMREAKRQAETQTIQQGKHLDDDASKSIFQMKSLTLNNFYGSK